jgi:hypothetical protein
VVNNWAVKGFILFVFVILLNHELWAQTITASPYSVYGVGTLIERTSVLNRALAGTGIAIRDPLSPNNLNPASYPSVQGASQIFETGMYLESDRYQTEQQSSKFRTGNITSLNYWFRFSTKWAGTLGLTPFSKVDYNIDSDRLIGVDGGSTVQYSGTGGISQFYFGNGFQLTPNLSVGVNASYIFGSVEKDETIGSGIGSGTVLRNKTSVNRLNADVGAQYTFFLKKKRAFSIGVTYDDDLRLHTSGDRVVFQSSTGEILSEEMIDVEDYVLPAQVGAGISFQTTRSTLAADFTFKKWSQAKLEEHTKLRDTKRFSLGYEYKGNPEALSYWDVIRFRSGFYLQENYLVLGKNSFSDWGWSLGLGLPVSANRGTISLTYNFNQSGTTANNLIKQQAHVLVLEFTIRDWWFVRRKFD